MYTSEYNGILFIEGFPENCSVIRMVSAKVPENLGQSKSLDSLKERLAEMAKSYGGNAIANFKYGQKSSFWSFNGVYWYASGIIVNLTD